jgi:hypothetical protein
MARRAGFRVLRSPGPEESGVRNRSHSMPSDSGERESWSESWSRNQLPSFSRPQKPPSPKAKSSSVPPLVPGHSPRFASFPPSLPHTPSPAHGHARLVSGQRSAVSGQRSAVCGQRSAVGGRRSAVGGRRSAVGGRRSERLKGVEPKVAGGKRKQMDNRENRIGTK